MIRDDPQPFERIRRDVVKPHPVDHTAHDPVSGRPLAQPLGYGAKWVAARPETAREAGAFEQPPEASGEPVHGCSGVHGPTGLRDDQQITGFSHQRRTAAARRPVKERSNQTG